MSPLKVFLFALTDNRLMTCQMRGVAGCFRHPRHFFTKTFGRFRKSSYLCSRNLSHRKVRWHSFNRKVGRVIDRAGLEIRYTPFGYRGFESLTFRKRSLTLHDSRKREPMTVLFCALIRTCPLASQTCPHASFKNLSPCFSDVFRNFPRYCSKRFCRLKSLSFLSVIDNPFRHCI